MAKRLSDSNKWDDTWFCELSNNDKLFWLYILDKCNHAGIWKANWKLVKFHLENFEYNKNPFENKILKITDEKYFIPKFINFQYGILDDNNRVHKSVIDILKKEGVFKTLTRPLLGCKDKDKEKAKAKDKDMDKDKESHNDNNNIEAVELADLLYTKIKENNPNALLKESFKAKWSNDLRLLNEQDKQPYTLIKQVLLWSQADDFWSKNILSGSKLRMKWNQLSSKMNGSKKSDLIVAEAGKYDNIKEEEV